MQKRSLDCRDNDSVVLRREMSKAKARRSQFSISALKTPNLWKWQNDNSMVNRVKGGEKGGKNQIIDN